jgi:hypothetical protein
MNRRAEKSELRILSFIESTLKEKEISPSYIEMGKAADLTPTGAARAVQRLIKKGFIEHKPHAKRGYSLTKEATLFLDRAEGITPVEATEIPDTSQSPEEAESLRARFHMAIFDKNYKKIDIYLNKELSKNAPAIRKATLEMAFALATLAEDPLAAHLVMQQARSGGMTRGDFADIAARHDKGAFYSRLPEIK